MKRALEELLELLVLRAGAVLSYNALHEDLQVAVESVRQWTDHLQHLYFLYLIRPFAGNIAHSLRREPKLRKREVDLLLTMKKKPWALIEVKLSDKSPTSAMSYFAERLRVPYRIQVVLECERPGMAGDVHVIDAANFLRTLPV